MALTDDRRGRVLPRRRSCWPKRDRATAGLKGPRYFGGEIRRRSVPASSPIRRTDRPGSGGISGCLAYTAVAFVRVQPEAGEVLQAQIASRLIGASLEPRLQVGRSAGVGRQQLDRGVEADLAQRLRDRRVLRAAAAAPRSRRRRSCVGSDLPEQHECRSPRRCSCCRRRSPFGNTSKNVAISLFTASGVALVELHEQRDDAARVQVRLRRARRTPSCRASPRPSPTGRAGRT